MSLGTTAVKMLGFHASELTGALAGAAVFAGLCWWAVSRYASLWNLRYRLTWSHHVLCGLAAASTLILVVLFVSLRYAREAAEASIDLWRLQILADASWADGTFRTAYGAIRALGVEDFDLYPAPEAGGHAIPQTRAETISATALVYANSAAADFRRRRSFLSRVLSVRPEVPKEAVGRALQNFFAPVLGQPGRKDSSASPRRARD